MKILGDYHTHTIYSHGKGTILENTTRAKELGLEQIGITDHSFGHQLYGVKRKNFGEMQEKVKEAEKETGVKVFLGMEANLCSSKGEIDLTPAEINKLDILLVGFHRFVKCPFRDKFRLFLPNILFKNVSNKQKERNTNALILAMDKYPIDVITHMFHGFKVDLERVAKKAVETKTYIELNENKMLFTQADIDLMLKLGVNFIISSDAHKVENIANTPKMLSAVEKFNIPPERVANLNKLPKFKKVNI